jgi:hypothetical protein
MKAESELQESIKPEKSTLEVNKGRGGDSFKAQQTFKLSGYPYTCTHMD